MDKKDNLNIRENKNIQSFFKQGRVLFHINETNSFSVYNRPEKSLVFVGERHRIGASAVKGESPDIDRMLLSFELPKMPLNYKVKSARLTIYQHSEENAARQQAFIGVQRIKDDIKVNKSAPISESSIIDFCKAKSGQHNKLHSVKYELDVTKFVLADVENGSSCCRIQIRMLDETGAPKNHIYIFGSESANFRPQIEISYVSETVLKQDKSDEKLTDCNSDKNGTEPCSSRARTDNLLQNHSFYSLHHWKQEKQNNAEFNNCCHLISKDILFGTRCYKMYACNEFSKQNGVYQDTIRLSKGDYTFSAYIRVRREIVGEEGRGAYISVTDKNGVILAESDRLTEIRSSYTRLCVNFSLKKALEVRVHILIDGRGEILVDATQLEKSAIPNPYNMIENGGFEYGMSNWEANDEEIYDTGITACENYRSLRITGNREKEMFVFQTVQINPNSDVNGSYVFSAMAKAVGANSSNAQIKNPPRFEISVEAVYYTAHQDRKVRRFTSPFSSETDGWHLRSVNIPQYDGETLSSLKLICDFSYNTGVAYFDSFYLTKRENY